MSADLSSAGDINAVVRKLYHGAPWQARTLQTLRPFICPFGDLVKWIPERGRVLDVGCGAGLFLGLVGYLRPHATGIGFDADASAINAAKSVAGNHFRDGRIQFERSAVGDPWPEGHFEVVSMIDVLHHIPANAQQEVIAESFRHVAPGGLFVYKDMASKPRFRAWWNRLHDMIIARQWIQYRPIKEVEEWLTTAGAEIVERSAKALGPYGHELLVAKKPS